MYVFKYCIFFSLSSLINLFCGCSDLSGLEGVLERERRREDFQELITQQMSTMQDALSSSLQVEVEAQMLRILGG
jgi:hypothetical protein